MHLCICGRWGDSMLACRLATRCNVLIARRSGEAAGNGRPALNDVGRGGLPLPHDVSSPHTHSCGSSQDDDAEALRSVTHTPINCGRSGLDARGRRQERTKAQRGGDGVVGQ